MKYTIEGSEFEMFLETKFKEYLESINFGNSKKWLTQKDAANYLGISYNTLQKYIKSGDIKIYGKASLKRINQSDLDQFLMSEAEFMKQ